MTGRRPSPRRGPSAARGPAELPRRRQPQARDVGARPTRSNRKEPGRTLRRESQFFLSLPPPRLSYARHAVRPHRHGKGETEWRGAESTRSDPDQPPADRDSLEDGAADPRPGGRRRPIEAGLRQLRRAARRRGASPRTSSPRRICSRRRSFRHGPPRAPLRWRGRGRCRPPPGPRRRRTGRTG
jgi:hypothetical protein